MALGINDHLYAAGDGEERLHALGVKQRRTAGGQPATSPVPAELWEEAVRKAIEEDETILQEAQRLVHGNRGADYGHPYFDFSKTALIWQAVLGIPVTPEQVALCMVGVKISREVNKPKRDNLVDGAGYFETLSMVREKRAELESKDGSI